MKRFRIISTMEAIGNKYPCWKELHEYQACLYEFDSIGQPIRFIAQDGGEPEDQSLYRDWSWVADELNTIGGPAITSKVP